MKVVITANGKGSRMRSISPTPKHLLYYKGRRIIAHIRDALSRFGDVEIIEGRPSESRRDTLQYIKGYRDVLICDCDIIPHMVRMPEGDGDAIWYFRSDARKYGCLWMDVEYKLMAADEGKYGSPYRASGLYFVRDVDLLLQRMTDPNSIASGMIGAIMVEENSFVRLGDPEDYKNAVK